MLRSRLARLNADAQPRWGRMTAAEMVAHLSQSVRLALGELPITTPPGALRFTPLRQIVIHWLPFPKGTAAPRELHGAPLHGWVDSLAELDALTERLVARAAEPSHQWPVHPYFGRLSRKEWGVLGYRHMDHHLRQFGV